jgi:mannose-6-phosphate isomerase-like protein (cupin superfamily)
MRQSQLAKKSREDRIGERVERPWGAWMLLEVGNGYKVKRLEVLPGKRLSLQRHDCRSEHWVVVQGTARVTNGDGVFLLETNGGTFIPVGAVHRLENADSVPLVVIEVQTGKDLRETDIIRLEDDFGRPVTE